MRKLLITFITLFNLNCFAQIKFENGYFINSNGEKTICLISNLDWKNNPTTFEYKIGEGSESKEASIQTVQEFGIPNILKYKRFQTKIDRSSTQMEALSEKRSPEFIEEILFLKVLVEGKATLYQYNDEGLLRFFYSVDESPVTQLVYKQYRAASKVAVNDSYKQELWNVLKCGTLSIDDVSRTKYSTRSLIKYFVSYNRCNQSTPEVFDEQLHRDLFNLTLRPGVNFSSLSISNDVSSDLNTDFGNKQNFRFGMEAEVILPFNKNKWSILVEPTYQQYKSGQVSGPYEATADYKSIELPFGIRHYFFLNEDSKIFINGQYLFDFVFKSKIDYEDANQEDLKIKPNGSLSLGVGFNYRNYSVELRHNFNRQLFMGSFYWGSQYETVAVIFGYRVF